MGDKMLPVIIENKKLSAELKKISVAHLFLKTIEEYNELFNNDGNINLVCEISLVKRIIVTTNPGLLNHISNSKICFISFAESQEGIKEIKKLASKNNNVIEFYSNVSERFMFDFDNYTQKQIRLLKDKYIDISESKRFGLDFVFVGKPNRISSIKSLIENFTANPILTNNHVDNNNLNVPLTCMIDTTKINSYYLTYEENSTTKLINKFCNTEIMKFDNTNNINSHTKTNKKRFIDGIDSTMYFKLGSDYDDEIFSLLMKFTKHINNDSNNIIIVINVEDVVNMNIDVIRNIVYDCSTTANYEDIIYLNKGIAIGTPNVIKHYCSLYDCYGMYEYNGTYDDYVNMNNCYKSILGNEYYSEFYRLSYSVQLYCHIRAYTDLVITKVCGIEDIELKEKPFVLVTYYGIYDQFDFVKIAIEKLGYTVYDYPFKKIISEVKLEEDETTNDIDTAIHNSLLNSAKKLLDMKPKYMLWWNIDLSAVTMTDIHNYNPRTKHLYFNWDEPYNFEMVKAARKSRLLTSAFVTCDETTVKYTENGALSAYCVYPGFDPCTHYPYWLKYYVWMHVMSVDDYDHGIMNDTYKMRKLITRDMNAMVEFINEDFNVREFQYDISFICTNLYEDELIYPDQIVNRKYLVETIYENQSKYNYKLGIYGPERFRDGFPDSYSCFIRYHNTNDAFNLSKINMCTHVIGNKKGYLNERIFLIMASGGLLFVDPIESDVLINGYNCVFIDQNRVIKQIKSILINYNRYTQIKVNAYLTAQKYCWDNWGLTIHEKLLELNNKN